MIAWEMFLQAMVAMNFPDAGTENENSTTKRPLGRIHEKKMSRTWTDEKKLGCGFLAFSTALSNTKKKGVLKKGGGKKRGW